MANRLAKETSPYLLQHAHNPVDWYPWGQEALTRAREEDRPILLSIGYSACHWCHVMERESFLDPTTAALMNEGFVNIKVDREERPDLDSIYMRGVQAVTGHGGWPLTAFLTPEGRLFYGGTYFPPEPRHGIPSFRQVLTAVADAFAHRRDEVERGAQQLLDGLATDAVREGYQVTPSDSANRGTEPLSGNAVLEAEGAEILDHAFQFLAGSFDPTHGGFGPAPKFPQPVILEFLLSYHHRNGRSAALDMVIQTLRAMARGGMRDHLGGGFHRYSVDDEWLVPHFEKMLYDNGLLARVYLHAFQVSGDQELLEAATSTLDYLLSDLRHPEGGFFSSRDADSEGEEGLFYLWKAQEVDRLLGPTDGPLFRRALGVTEGGNFEGRNILHRLEGPEELAEATGRAPGEVVLTLASARTTLHEARAKRKPPLRDEKVLTEWNAYVVRALAEAGVVLGREDYLDAARSSASFLLGSLERDGRLYRSWKDGDVRVLAFLGDHASLGNALLSLHEATLESHWLAKALSMAEVMVQLFWDEDRGLFFDTARDAEILVVRPRAVTDSATPSGNSLAAEFFLRGGHLSGDEGYREKGTRALAAELEGMRRFPSAFGRLLSSLALHQGPPLEVTLVGNPADPVLKEMNRVAHAAYGPDRVVVGGDPEQLPALPMLEGRTARKGHPTAYVCRQMVCGPPLHTAEALRQELMG